ncbi:MAG: phage tail tape measure protein, partial [Plesiomonas sp.]
MGESFQLKALITGVDKLSPSLTKIQKNIQKLRRNLSGVADGALPFAAGVAVALAAPLKLAIDFESAMADVKKVVDFDTPKQFAEMSKDVLGLSKKLPMLETDIAKIYAAGGQSGIARRELKAFATDAIKMGVAFDMAAGDAGQSMAQWRTAFKMTQDQVRGLADQINYLGNTGPANALKISDVVTRVGSLGDVAGVNSGDIAAIGATITGVGKEADVASTGIKSLLLTLTSGKSMSGSQKKAFSFIKIDPKKLAVDMQKDSKSAILMVFKALSKVDKSKQAAVLSSMFGKESVDSLAALLNNIPLLEGNLDKVADKTKYLGSMNKEYASRAETTAFNLILMTNRLRAIGITIGSFLLPPLNSLLDSVAPLLDLFSSVAASNPEIIKGIIGAAFAFGFLKLAVFGIRFALQALFLTTKMSPFAMFIRVAALGIGYIASNWDKYAPVIKKHLSAIKLLGIILGNSLLFLQLRWIKTAVSMGKFAGFLSLISKLGTLRGAIFALRAVVMANPLGLLLTAAYLIIDNFETISKWLDTIKEKMLGWIGLQ